MSTDNYRIDGIDRSDVVDFHPTVFECIDVHAKLTSQIDRPLIEWVRDKHTQVFTRSGHTFFYRIQMETNLLGVFFTRNDSLVEAALARMEESYLEDLRREKTDRQEDYFRRTSRSLRHPDGIFFYRLGKDANMMEGWGPDDVGRPVGPDLSMRYDESGLHFSKRPGDKWEVKKLDDTSGVVSTYDSDGFLESIDAGGLNQPNLLFEDQSALLQLPEEGSLSDFFRVFDFPRWMKNRMLVDLL